MRDLKVVHVNTYNISIS